MAKTKKAGPFFGTQDIFEWSNFCSMVVILYLGTIKGYSTWNSSYPLLPDGKHTLSVMSPRRGKTCVDLTICCFVEDLSQIVI